MSLPRKPSRILIHFAGGELPDSLSCQRRNETRSLGQLLRQSDFDRKHTRVSRSKIVSAREKERVSAIGRRRLPPFPSLYGGPSFLPTRIYEKRNVGVCPSPADTRAHYGEIHIFPSISVPRGASRGSSLSGAKVLERGKESPLFRAGRRKKPSTRDFPVAVLRLLLVRPHFTALLQFLASAAGGSPRTDNEESSLHSLSGSLVHSSSHKIPFFIPLSFFRADYKLLFVNEKNRGRSRWLACSLSPLLCDEKKADESGRLQEWWADQFSAP